MVVNNDEMTSVWLAVVLAATEVVEAEALTVVVKAVITELHREIKFFTVEYYMKSSLFFSISLLINRENFIKNNVSKRKKLQSQRKKLSK